MRKIFAVTIFSMLLPVLNAKPVGIWQSYSGARVRDLFNTTVMNPQWSKLKPVFEVFKGGDFEKYSVIVYLMGNDRPAIFKEWTRSHIEKAEKFVRNGGTLVIIGDGAPPRKITAPTGLWKNLLGAARWGTLKGRADFPAPKWQECGKNPAVHKFMLRDGYAVLKELTTGKMLVGNDSGAVVASNELGKGRVLFFNVKLTQAFTPYRQRGGQGAQAALDQLFPFAKAIYSFIMAAKPDAENSPKELWDYQPLGPKKVYDDGSWKPEIRPVRSRRKMEKLSGRELCLISDGKAHAVIANCQAGDRPAGGMLNRVLKKMSGVSLPVVPMKAVRSEGDMWKWRKEKFHIRIEFVLQNDISIRAENNKLIIGAPTQQLGVVCFLREILDYRMLWPGKSGEVYKKSSKIAFAPFHLTDAPFFRRRYIRNSFSQSKKDWKRPDGTIVKLNLAQELLDRVKFTGLDPEEIAALWKNHGSWFAIQRLGGKLPIAGGSNFTNYYFRFSKTHPEYMALQFNGTRKMIRPKNTRICKSNDALIRQAAEDCRKLLDKRPNLKYLSVSPSDGNYDIFCMCENCRKWDPADGKLTTKRVFLNRNRPTYRYPSFSDRVVRFTAAVARELKKTHPQLKILYLAYAGYQRPPEYFRDFPDNMAVTFVGFQYLNRNGLEQDRKSWDFWASRVKELILRPNYLLGGRGFPVVYVHEMAKDIRHCAETGMIASDFDSLTHNWAVNGLNYYVLAQLLWDPAQNVDDIIDDYCQKGFGKAADVMKKYFLHCEKLTAKLAESQAENIQEVEDLTSRPQGFIDFFMKSFTDAEFDKLQKLLDEARQLASDDKESLQRVEFIAAGLAFSRNRVDFARKYRELYRTKNRSKLSKLAAEQQKYWHELFRKYPFAVNIPALAINQYYSYWRHCK